MFAEWKNLSEFLWKQSEPALANSLLIDVDSVTNRKNKAGRHVLMWKAAPGNGNEESKHGPVCEVPSTVSNAEKQNNL